jgi:hypothetical protein
MDGIFGIAEAIDTKQITKGSRPKLTNILPEEGFVTERTRYFRGSAGLNMLLPFGLEDISGFREGIYSDFGTHRLIVFEYECTGNRKVGLKNIISNLRNQNEYTDLSGTEIGYLFEDKEGNKLVIENLDTHVMVYSGKDITRQPEIFERIEDALYNDSTEYPLSGIVPVY